MTLHACKIIINVMVTLSPVIVASVCVVATLALFAWLRKFKQRQRIVDQIPGPKSVPIFGNSLSFPSSATDFYLYLENLSTTYFSQGLFRLWYGPHPVIVLYKAEMAEVILKSSKHIQKSFFYSFFKLWLKTGLITSSGPKWFARRKLLTSAFHFKILDEFVEIVNEQAETFVKILERKVGQGAFDVQPYITRCTLDVICETAMGKSVNAQSQTDSEYVAAIYRVSDLIIQRMKSPWLWPEFTFRLSNTGREILRCVNILHSFTRKVIQDRSAQFDKYYYSQEIGAKNGEISSGETAAEDEPLGKPIRIGKRMAFLDLLLNAAKNDANLTPEDIQEEVDTFMFAGHDTTGAAATWFLYVMGIYPEIQRKVQEELDSIFGGNEREVTSDDLNKMKYLECVFKETLRLYPPVPVFDREMTEDLKIGDYTFVKGASVLFLTVPYHRDPKHFPDPMKFDPDRWTNMSVDRHPFSYIPFSAGFRNCIGQKFALMEEKILLSHLLRRFHVTFAENHEPKRCGSVVLRPENGLHIQLERRND